MFYKIKQVNIETRQKFYNICILVILWSVNDVTEIVKTTEDTRWGW